MLPSAPNASALGRRPAGDIGGSLALLGDGPQLAGFHAPLLRATMLYARQCARGGARDDDRLIAQLREAIENAPRRPDRSIADYLADDYLHRAIDGAFRLISAEPDLQTMRPHHAAPTTTVEEARAELRRQVQAFLTREQRHHNAALTAETEPDAPHGALVVGTGLGKTQETMREVAKRVATMKAAGLPHRVLWLVPNHKLAGQTLERMADQQIDVAVYRGRDALDPDHRDFADPDKSKEEKGRMCLNLPAVEDALKAQANVETAICGTGEPGKPSCPWRNECAFQKQKHPAAKADVVIASNVFLFTPLPKELLDGVGLVVTDESWWQSGLLPAREIRLGGFADEPLQYPVRRDGQPHELDTNDLHAICCRLMDAVGRIPAGGMWTRAACEAAGLTADDCDLSHKLEWNRKRDELRPGMSVAERRAAVAAAEGNATIPRRAALWRTLATFLREGGALCGRVELADDEGRRRLLLHTRRAVRSELARLPILALDATMPAEVVRHYLPRLEVLADVHATTPHVEVTQITGGWGKTTLVPSERASSEENTTRKNRLGALADFVRLHRGDKGLVITYQAIEVGFAALPGVATEHFNNFAGVDDHGDVDSLFVIGRPLPDVRELRQQALALTGRPIMLEGGRLETRGARLADGTGAAVNVRAYDDPDLESLRVAITEAEVVQAIGRGRGVNRSADNPLRVFLMADVVVPVTLHRLTRWEDARPTDLHRMLARGVFYWSPADAHRAYSDIFPTRKTAAHVLERGRDFCPISLWISTHRGLGQKSLTQVSYRPIGRGQQQRMALVAPDALPGFEANLVTLFGPLAAFAILGGGKPPPAAAAPSPSLPEAPYEADNWEPMEPSARLPVRPADDCVSERCAQPLAAGPRQTFSVELSPPARRTGVMRSVAVFPGSTSSIGPPP